MIGSDIAAMLPQFQQLSDSLLTDTFKVTRPDPDNPGSWDPETGEVAPGEITVYPSIKGQFRPASADEREVTAGEHQWSLSDVIWRVPAGTTGVDLGDTVACTDSPQGVNMGGEFTVMFALTGSHLSSPRFVVRRVDG